MNGLFKICIGEQMVKNYRGFDIHKDSGDNGYFASIKPSWYIYKDNTIELWDVKYDEVDNDDILNQLVYYDNIEELKQDIDWFYKNKPEELI